MNGASVVDTGGGGSGVKVAAGREDPGVGVGRVKGVLSELQANKRLVTRKRGRRLFVIRQIYRNKAIPGQFALIQINIDPVNECSNISFQAAEGGTN